MNKQFAASCKSSGITCIVLCELISKLGCFDVILVCVMHAVVSWWLVSWIIHPTNAFCLLVDPETMLCVQVYGAVFLPNDGHSQGCEGSLLLSPQVAASGCDHQVRPSPLFLFFF